MNLFSPEDLARTSYLPGPAGRLVARILMQLLGLKKVNRTFSNLRDKEGLDFITALQDQLEIKIEISEEDKKRIPAAGAFIAISNHPFGGIDNLLLIKIIGDIRKDFKLLGDSLTRKIEPIANHIIRDNPFDSDSPGSRFTGLKCSLKHLSEGNALGLFPAPEEAAYTSDSFQVQDTQWNNQIIQFIKKAEVPVIPVYFAGSNSWIFHLLGRIHPILKSAKLPSELINKKRKTIRIRIGNPISVKEQKELGDYSRLGRYLRARTYALGTHLEVRKFFKNPLKRLQRVEPIIEAIKPNLIQQEIDALDQQYLLFESKAYRVICAPAAAIPNTLIEIGRLREITFREVGEGTNRSFDLDEFDLYYHQLIIWDSEASKIVGAYRIGKGKDIFDLYGNKGFYLQSLFRIKKPFNKILQESLELGRSFIVKEYQRKPLSLFLLWKGILYFLIKNPEYRYMIGPVSISNDYSKFSKTLIVEYLKQNHYQASLAKHIQARKEFVVQDDLKIDKAIILENAQTNINQLDSIIKDVEQKFSMPVLLKKYLSMGGQLIGFNIDPKFNNALDGFIILDIFNVPTTMIESLSKELNDPQMMERFLKSDSKP